MAEIYTIEVGGHRLKIQADSPDQALEAANGWKSGSGPAPSAKDVAYDVAASGAAGLGEGTAQTFGALGDVRNAIGSGAGYLANKAGISPANQAMAKALIGGAASANPLTGPFAAATRLAPTSADIRGQMEKVTGEFHKPTTTAGEYAKAGAEAVPAAMFGPEGIGIKLAIGVGSGLGGEFIASRFAGTPYEPWARMIGQIIGGGGTSAAGKGVEAMRNYSAARSTGQNIGDILGTDAIKPGAVRRTAQSAADDNLTLPGVADTQARLGPETMAMDLGRQMQGRAEAVATQPGKAQNTVLDAVEGRTGEYGSGARSRIEDTLNRQLGPTENVVKLLDDVDAAVQARAKPAYDKVMADHPVIAMPSEITSRPAVAQAMKQAESLAKNYGESLSTSERRTILSGPGYHIADDVTQPAQTSLKYWDYVKKAMDQRISGMMRNGVDDLSSVEKADLGGLLNAKQALVSHLDNVTQGAYADARRIAATKPELHEAMDFGRSIFGSKLLPEEVAAQIAEMSIPAQAMAQVGARRELARVLDSARNDGAKARAFLDTNNNRAKIANLFGEDAARAIENRVGAENTFQEATQTIARNSRTAVRGELIKDTADPAPASYAPSLLGVARAAPLSALNYIRQHGMENTREGIANMLTARGGQISPMVEQLLNYNTKKASNAATPMNQQAAILARILMSGSNYPERGRQ